MKVKSVDMNCVITINSNSVHAASCSFTFTSKVSIQVVSNLFDNSLPGAADTSHFSQQQAKISNILEIHMCTYLSIVINIIKFVSLITKLIN